MKEIDVNMDWNVKLDGILLATLMLLAYGCQSRGSQTDINLLNGEMDLSNSYPAVYGIVRGSITDTKFAFPTCTGTAISSSVLLTAAHCVIPKIETAEPQIFSLVEGIFQPVLDEKGTPVTGSGRVVNPDFKKSEFFLDFAAIQFPVGTFKTFVDRSPVRAMVDSKVTLVGYAFDIATPNKVGRQFGTNTIAEIISNESIVSEKATIPEKYYREFFDGMYSVLKHRNSNTETGTIPGDSGGPLFLDGKLVGVLRGGSGAYGADDLEVEHSSLYVDILHPRNVLFLESLKKEGWDIPESAKSPTGSK
jgi:Trypsin